MDRARFFAQTPEEVGIDPEKLDALFERAAREVDEGHLPSAQLAVARNGRIAGMRTLGRVTHEGRDAEATDDTLYCIFSCTKAIISASAWLLLQEGKLDPAERVVDVVPEFGTNGKDAVRVEHLFTHTAGFPQAPYPQREWHDREARLRRFASWRLDFEPGTRFEYHPSSSMWVIAEILERRSGLPYREFVRTRIAEPLGLPDLRVGAPVEVHDRLADIAFVGDEPTGEDYARMGFPVPPETEVTEEAVTNFNRAQVRTAGVPGGGGWMTAADLALFYQGLLHGGAVDGPVLWKDETLRRAREVRTQGMINPMVGQPVLRGLGVEIAGDEKRVWRGFGHTNTPLAFGHGGAGGQIGWADPGTGISFAYVTNGHDRNPMRLGRRGVGLSSRAAACLLDA